MSSPSTSPGPTSPADQGGGTAPGPTRPADQGSGGAADLGGPGSDRRSAIYEETRRTLDRQATVLGELRDRANILLTANAIVATIFGATVLDKSHPLALKIATLVVFTAGVGACVAVVWPVRDHGTLPHYKREAKPAAESGRQLFLTRMKLLRTGLKNSWAWMKHLWAWIGGPWPPAARDREWKVTFNAGKVADFLHCADMVKVNDISAEFARASKTNWRTIARLSRYLVAASVLLGVQIVLWAILVLS
jgi:hypothetical protein